MGQALSVQLQAITDRSARASLTFFLFLPIHAPAFLFLFMIVRLNIDHMFKSFQNQFKAHHATRESVNAHMSDNMWALNRSSSVREQREQLKCDCGSASKSVLRKLVTVLDRCWSVHGLIQEPNMTNTP